jgi:hypothetical protein
MWAAARADVRRRFSPERFGDDLARALHGALAA